MAQRLLSALVAALVVSASAAAIAQPRPVERVVVESFRGPRGANMRASLVESLQENGVVVVDESEVDAARARLSLGRSLDDAQRVQLATELNVSAFISGAVRRERRRWTGSVRVRNGADGAQLGASSWGGRTAASLGAIRRNGYQRLAGFLSSASSPRPPEPEPVIELPVERPPEPIEEPEPEEPEPSDASTRYDALRIMINGGTLYRQMDTTVQVYESQRTAGVVNPDTTLRSEGRRYQSGGIGHFELGGRAELYPGAFDDQSFPYLGAVLSFSHSVGVQSNGRSRADGSNVAVPTDQLDFYFGLRGRYRFGPARREPEIYLDAGWGMLEFNLGTDALQQIDLNTVIPPMSHGYVHLGAGITYGIVPTYLTLGLEVGGRIGTNIGADSRNVWGIETGPSNGFQIGASLKVEIPEIVQGFFLATTFQYFQMITDFNGQVGCSQAAICDDYMNPWEDRRLWEVWPVTPPPAGSAADLNAVIGGPVDAVTDHYVRLQITVGYAYY